MSNRRLTLFKPSASYSALLLSDCNHWMQPGSEWYDDSFTDTTKRDAGSDIHEAVHLAETVDGFDVSGHLRFGCDNSYELAERVAMVARARKFCKQLREQGYTLLFEQAIGLDPVTRKAVRYGTIEHRKYPDDGYMHGSIDLVAEGPNGELEVIDWKTGGGTGVIPQLKTLHAGWVLSSTKHFTQHTLRAVYLSHEGSETIWSVLQGELDKHCLDLEFAMAQKPTGPIPGAHCTQLYCPHLAYCSATEHVEQSIGEHNVKLTTDPVSDSDAGEILDAIRRSERRIKYFKEAMKAYVRRGGQPEFGDEKWDNSTGKFQWTKK